MAEIEFRELIQRPESDVLDFKQQGYIFSESKSRLDFIKDVLAMANTPRTQPAHIVLGVKWTPENGAELIGLDVQLDDVKFQGAIGTGWTQPKPRFIYKPILFEGRHFGVIEVEVSQEGPFTALKDGDGLQAGALYWRRGTQNERAVGTELRQILNWFTGMTDAVADPEYENIWPSVFAGLNKLESATSFILVVDRIANSTGAALSSLGNVPWRAVFDFDPQSDVDGLLSSVSSKIEQANLIHKVVRGDSPLLQINSGIFWFFAKGLSGRQDTLVQDDYRNWVRYYKSEIGKQIQGLAGRISPSPVVALVIFTDILQKKYIRSMAEELTGAFGETIEIMVIAENSELERALSEDVEDGLLSVFKLDLRSICNGLFVHYADQASLDDDRCVMPTTSGAPVEIQRDTVLWIRENLELVDRTAGMSGSDEATQYRKGSDVNWRNLNLHHDCDRDIHPALYRQVEEDLRRRQTVRVNLYHAPGAGGTTLGRRVAWDLHNIYPVLILNNCSPKDTADRIGKISAITGSCVLVVINGGHAENEIDALFEYLKASHIPAVLLRVVRRIKKPGTGKRMFWLEAALSDAEAERFRVGYGKESPSKKHELAALSKLSNDIQRNAFFFGLTAFEKDFLGLVPYVKSRLENLNSDQKQVIGYIALAHYYGQESIPGQAFAPLLNFPRSKFINLSLIFTGDRDSALDLIVLNEHAEWRMSHQLVALEVIQQLLSNSGVTENSEIWRQKISLWAKEFATFCRGDDPVISERMLKLVRRVFVYRDNSDFLGTESSGTSHFSKIIEDIPSSHGKVELLRHLISCYPDEAHLYAHLGRFLGLNGNFNEGLDYIDKSISIQDDDHVLHHMRGMVLRQKMRAEKERGATVRELVEVAENASASFTRSRILNPEKEHGYIGEIQMLIQLVDWSAQSSRMSIWELIGQNNVPLFLKNAIERAEALIDEVFHLYADEKPSRFVIDCRAKLQLIYGDFTAALQAWDNLLSRPDTVLSPIRRQIVWTILRRHKGSFHTLTIKERDRVIRLLSENLDEDVNDSTSLRLWLRAIRQNSIPPSLDSVLEKVAYWKTNTGSLDAAYYLYVLHTLSAMEGSRQSAADAEQALDECRALSRYRRDRTKSFEWVGPGKGIVSLVHQSRLGEWKGDFWEHTDALMRMTGRIVSIEAPQKGYIEIEGGLKAFFVPAKSDIHLNKDENAIVQFFVGFSYEGLRAWDVQKM